MRSVLSQHNTRAALLGAIGVIGGRTSQDLARLCDLCRENPQDSLAWQLLALRLAPLLVSLAGLIQTERPEDLLSALFEVVMRGARRTPEIEVGIRRAFHDARRVENLVSRKHQAFATSAEPERQTEPVEVDFQKPLQRFVDGGVLTEEDRYLLIGHHTLGHPLSRLANDLGMSPDAAWQRVHRATHRLKNTLPQKIDE